MAQFVVSGLAAVALIVILVLVAFARAGREEAAASATEVTRVTAATVIAPLVDERVLAGDRDALARLDSRLRLGVLREPVLRVTIYRPDGTLVYSSNPDYGSSGFTEDMREALRTGETYTRVGDPLEPGSDVPAGVQLLDVYQPVVTPGGERLLVESCRRLTAVRADGRALIDRFAPYMIGGVLALQLINLPLAIVLVKRSASPAPARDPGLRPRASPARRRPAQRRHPGHGRAVDGAQRRAPLRTRARSCARWRTPRAAPRGRCARRSWTSTRRTCSAPACAPRVDDLLDATTLEVEADARRRAGRAPTRHGRAGLPDGAGSRAQRGRARGREPDRPAHRRIDGGDLHVLVGRQRPRVRARRSPRPATWAWRS